MDSETVTELARILELTAEYATALGGEVWWRGQANAEWDLLPGVYRDGRNSHYEMGVTLRFWRAAPTRYPKCPPREELSTWLQLMQHYRLPTRLLDWTQSPLIALFFAVDELPDCDATLWALSPYRLNKTNSGDATVFSTADPRIRALVNPAFNVAAPASHHTLATFGEEIDLRMTLQLSAFTIHGTAAPLNHDESHRQYLKRLVIPASSKAGFSLALELLGIRRSNLFPDLETLSRELAGLTFGPEDI
jgi:hypothetical protein